MGVFHSFPERSKPTIAGDLSLPFLTNFLKPFMTKQSSRKFWSIDRPSFLGMKLCPTMKGTLMV